MCRNAPVTGMCRPCQRARDPLRAIARRSLAVYPRHRKRRLLRGSGKAEAAARWREATAESRDTQQCAHTDTALARGVASVEEALARCGRSGRSEPICSDSANRSQLKHDASCAQHPVRSGVVGRGWFNRGQPLESPPFRGPIPYHMFRPTSDTRIRAR